MENVYAFPKTHCITTLKPHLFFSFTFAGIERFLHLTLEVEILKK
jgi:hypothetical protein